MTAAGQRGSSSIHSPHYWWYRARAGLLQAALGTYLGTPSRLLDVGSADGPSVEWMRGDHQRVAIDLDPRGLNTGEGVCASASALPFDTATFDVVGAFDVIEHCPDEGAALAEMYRVLSPGGRLLVSVPAYEWAWSGHDVRAGHYRRYTRGRLVSAAMEAGFVVDRATYAFGAVFPLFVTERIIRRVRERRADRHEEQEQTASLPYVHPVLETILLGLCRAESRLLRRTSLPVGSSVLLAAVKPAG